MDNWTTPEDNTDGNDTHGNATTWGFENEKCEFIVAVLVTSFLCLFGLLGNSVTIAVLRRDHDTRRSLTTNWLLETLSVADCTFLLFAFVLVPIRTIAMGYSSVAESVTLSYDTVVYFLFICARIARTMSIWIVVLVTVDRYLAACRPLATKWRSLCRMKIAVLVLFVLSVVYRIPEFIGLDDRMEVACEGSEDDCNDWVHYYYIYHVACPFIFVSIGPFLILLVLNIRICVAIKELQRRRSEMTQTATEEKTLSVIVVIVVVVFVICQLPMSVLSVLRLSVLRPTSRFFPDEVYWKAINCSFVTINVLLVVNSCVNFLVYCLIWGKFRRILSCMMTCGRQDLSLENKSTL